MDIKNSITSFYHKSIRVWHILKKPSKKEFEIIAKVSAIGIGIIGAIGFIIAMIMKLFV